MAVHSFGGNALFSRACTCEASGAQRPPKTTSKKDGRACSGSFLGPGSVSDVGIFSFSLGSFPDSTAPGKSTRRPAPSKPPPEPRSDASPRGRTQRQRRVRGLAAQHRRREGTPPPLPGWLRQGSEGGGGGVQASRARRASKDVESRVFLVSHTESRALEFRIAGSQIPSNGLCRHVLLASEQFLLRAYVHFIV